MIQHATGSQESGGRAQATQQPELLAAGAQHHVSAESVQGLRTALSDGKWHTAKMLWQSHGLGDRELRIIRQQYRDEFVTGNQGYKLAVHCTGEEYAECIGRHRGQVAEMQLTIIALERGYHRALTARRAPVKETLKPSPCGLPAEATRLSDS